MQAETLGKYKFIMQAYAVVGLLVHYQYWGLDFFAAGMYFLVLSAVIALWSGRQLSRAIFSPATARNYALRPAGEIDKSRAIR